MNTNALLIDKMKYKIGGFTIYRDDYWNLNDNERQHLHDLYDTGSKALEFDMRFAEKHKRKV